MQKSLKNEEIIKRTEKLISAVYLVSDLMEGDDPLKLELRNRGVELLSTLSFSTGLSIKDNILDYKKSILLASGIVSLLDTAHSARLISDMNWSVLREEYFNIVSSIESVDEMTALGNTAVSIGADFFTISVQDTPETKFIGIPSSIGGEMGKGKQPPFYKGQNLKDNKKSLTNIKRKPSQAKNVNPSNKSKESGAQDKSNRREAILDVVRKNGSVTVKDVLGVVSGYSDKTIQRELLGLVSQNVLKKEGEKRWSKYSLA